MSFQAIINFNHVGENYLTVQTTYEEYAHDMVLETLHSCISLLYLCEHKFDDDTIDKIIRRIEELRETIEVVL